MDFFVIDDGIPTSTNADLLPQMAPYWRQNKNI